MGKHRMRLAVAIALTILVGATLSLGLASAQDIRFFRIGTGSTAGVNFSVGSLLASVLSNPPGSRPCDRGGSCGVPGLIAIVQATPGSAANAREVGTGSLDSGIVQADVAGNAYAGKGSFTGKNRQENLRALASLYPEILQIVVRRDAKVKSLADLKGKRVSLDTEGSGTEIAARMVLTHAGVKLSSLKTVDVDLGAAVDMMRQDQLDAFFYAGGLPAPAISQLSELVPIDLLPVSGTLFDRIHKAAPAYEAVTISRDVYPGLERDVETMSVHSLWVVSADLDEQLAYDLLQALWHRTSKLMLASGHPNGRLILPESALKGLTIPLHPGAEKYYAEMKLLPPAAGDGNAVGGGSGNSGAGSTGKPGASPKK